MKPEARCHVILVVAGFVEACGEEVLGYLTILGKAIDTFVNFEIDPTIAGFIGEVVFLEKIIGNIG